MNRRAIGRLRTFALIAVGVVALVVQIVAQGTGRAGQATAPTGRGAATRAANQPATVLQVMRGILFPNSNLIFFAQGNDPATVKKADDPSTATDPLASTYGGWDAVANAAVALQEATRLLTVPRMCSDGKPAPINAATWQKGLEQLRAAGGAALKAAQAKNQDQIVDASDQVATACSTCHDVYREKTPRCTP